MNSITLVLGVAAIVFGRGVVGQLLQRALPEKYTKGAPRDMWLPQLRVVAQCGPTAISSLQPPDGPADCHADLLHGTHTWPSAGVSEPAPMMCLALAIAASGLL